MQAKAGATESRDGWKTKIEGAVYEQVPGTVCPGIFLCYVYFASSGCSDKIRQENQILYKSSPSPNLRCVISSIFCRR